jgi:DNA-binding winged helix-turn-helix (wHTH) protein
MISFPPFRLDANNKCVWKCLSTGAMQKLTLAPRAFDMLEFLVRNAGQLVTHEGLLTALWPNQWVQPEVIKTYVRSIRAVLDDDARQPKFIETHRSRGYRFIAEILSRGPDDLASPPRTGNLAVTATAVGAPGALTLRDIAALLERISHDQASVCVVADSHRDDDSTLDSLSPRSRNIHAVRLTLIVNYLPEETVLTSQPVSAMH